MSYHQSYYYQDLFSNVFFGTFAAASYLIALAVSILFLAGRWKVFKKAGKPGWATLIPFYGDYCYMDICFGTGWLFLLKFVPCVGFIIQIMSCFKLSKAFRQGTGFGFGLLFLSSIFMLILGFGNYQYYGVDGLGFGPNGVSYDEASMYR